MICPICRYPFGSGGNLNLGLPPVINRCSEYIYFLLHYYFISLGLISSSLSHIFLSFFYYFYSNYERVYFTLSKITRLSMPMNFSLRNLHIWFKSLPAEHDLSFSWRTPSFLESWLLILSSYASRCINCSSLLHILAWICEWVKWALILISLISHLINWSSWYWLAISSLRTSVERCYLRWSRTWLLLYTLKSILYLSLRFSSLESETLLKKFKHYRYRCWSLLMICIICGDTYSGFRSLLNLIMILVNERVSIINL